MRASPGRSVAWNLAEAPYSGSTPLTSKTGSAHLAERYAYGSEFLFENIHTHYHYPCTRYPTRLTRWAAIIFLIAMFL